MSNNEVEISVIIPSYERPVHLSKLLSRLSQSTFRKFEVIVVDQSARPISLKRFNNKLNIKYHRVNFRGAALARNYGATLAEGTILAFTDDDCIPDEKWLDHAYSCFKKNKLVGLEGRIYPEKHKSNPQKFRIVSNIGREGIAFMTANLFVLRKCFWQIGGFDEGFNEPHFREDTDFGWRLQRIGMVMFSDNVKVLHPSERKLPDKNRSYFFVHDALLFSKHPDKYIELFVLEEHYIHTEGFWDYFIQGFIRHEVDISLLNKLFINKYIKLEYIPMHKVVPLLI